MMVKNRFIKKQFEFILIGIISILIFLVLSSLETFEVLVEWTRQHEEYEVDEFILLLPVLVFALSIHSYFKSKQIKKINQDLNFEIAERKLAESELRESQFLLTTHLENTPLGVIKWDQELRVIDWNPAAERIFGYTKNEIKGNDISNLIFKNKKELLTEVFENLTNGKGDERILKNNINKNGEVKLCEWYNSLLRNSEGSIICVASLVSDLTDKKRTEELLIQSEKMLSIGGLAAGMAHEINNPLAGIIQNAQVVQNRLTKKIPANETAAKEIGISIEAIAKFMDKRKILSQIESIRQEGLRAAKIVENMLSFSKKSNSIRQEVNLDELIDRTIDLALNDYSLKKGCDFKKAKIIKEYDSKIPLIYCEATKIQQVLFNIIKNATEAMSLIKIEQKLIFRLYKTAKMVCIEIEDNGPGMDKGTRVRVFEPFYTTKGVDKGTGLGLSVSYLIIVDDHKGSIDVESTLGKGTKFVIKLPFRSDDSEHNDRAIN